MRLRRAAALAGPGLAALASTKLRPASTRCRAEVSYYGSYSTDRFGGGIGRRVGLDESGSRPVAGTCLRRVVLIKESHENLARWATAENWKEATRIHKAAYFTRATKPNQEALLEKLRQHYVFPEGRSWGGYTSTAPVQAALFRCDDVEAFQQVLRSTKVTHIPSVVFGKMDEKSEACITDFANKRIGGGWLGYGHVQEEIMFAERFDAGALCARSLLEMPGDPIAEPIASPFSMHQDEAWIFKGCPAFAHIPWYGRVPDDWDQKLTLLNPKEDHGSTPTIICIDAIKAAFEQYEREHLDMMVLKAYCGFAAARHDPDVGGERLVSTGSWGCGAFYNNECVMFVVQVLAASAAGVRLTHHVLGDGRRLAPAFELLEEVMLKKLSVAAALDLLAERCASDPQWRSKYRPNPGAKHAPRGR